MNMFCSDEKPAKHLTQDSDTESVVSTVSGLSAIGGGGHHAGARKRWEGSKDYRSNNITMSTS